MCILICGRKVIYLTFRHHLIASTRKHNHRINHQNVGRTPTARVRMRNERGAWSHSVSMHGKCFDLFIPMCILHEIIASSHCILNRANRAKFIVISSVRLSNLSRWLRSIFCCDVIPRSSCYVVHILKPSVHILNSSLYTLIVRNTECTANCLFYFVYANSLLWTNATLSFIYQLLLPNVVALPEMGCPL